MPRSPQRRCSWPAGCGAMVNGGRCPAHRRSAAPSTTTNATPTRQQYSWAHRNQPLGDECERCGATENLQRGHRVAKADGGADDDDENYVTLCGSCNAIQARADTARRRQSP